MILFMGQRWPVKGAAARVDRTVIPEARRPVAVDFTLSDSQQELQKNAQAFAEGVLRPTVDSMDRAAD
jgi:hypothetical protein